MRCARVCVGGRFTRVPASNVQPCAVLEGCSPIPLPAFALQPFCPSGRPRNHYVFCYQEPPRVGGGCFHFLPALEASVESSSFGPRDSGQVDYRVAGSTPQGTSALASAALLNRVPAFLKAVFLFVLSSFPATSQVCSLNI
jgi:hypothetical protein